MGCTTAALIGGSSGPFGLFLLRLRGMTRLTKRQLDLCQQVDSDELSDENEGVRNCRHSRLWP